MAPKQASLFIRTPIRVPLISDPPPPPPPPHVIGFVSHYLSDVIYIYIYIHISYVHTFVVLILYIEFHMCTYI